MRVELLVSCEHGGNRVPRAYRALFAGADDALASHRGYDAGALEVAQLLAAKLEAPLVAAHTTRLLVDLNRSPQHPRLFSEWSRALDAEQKRELLALHYAPYRDGIEAAIGRAAARGVPMLHISSHSFVPVLDGVVRRADVGLLFDPARPHERSFAGVWREALRAAAPGWSIRRNYPYRGVADGLTTYLRRRFRADEYLGLELEVNQRRVAEAEWPRHIQLIGDSLADALRSWDITPP